LRPDIEKRVIDSALHIIDNKSTVRATAKFLGVSKSTVHKDVTDRLPEVDAVLAAEVRKILDLNKEERHIRGGEATRKKYKR
jgi:putative DeoR family transcriptional regulator (stage III sporulation protein D)